MDRVAALREIEALLRRHTGAEEEARILSLLRSRTDADLDALLMSLDLSRLLEAMDDRMLGPNHRTALVRLLCQDRLGALSVPNRASLVAALQRGRTSAVEEQGIRDVMLGTTGAALGALKGLLNSTLGYQDLAKLVAQDLDDPRLSSEILAHFRGQAEALRPGPLAVLSDIDDTIVSALHDRRYPRGVVYPGVVALHEALRRGPSRASEGSLTLLTARPGDRLGVVESLTLSQARAMGIHEASVLTGEVSDLMTHTDMARGKYENILFYRELFPEHPLLWIGDNGQGDAILGGWLMAEPTLEVRGAFIHDVTGASAEQRAELADRGVTLFDTYVGAALLAFHRGLVDAEALLAVTAAAELDLAAMNLEPADRRAREAELAADATEARRAAGQAGF